MCGVYGSPEHEVPVIATKQRRKPSNKTAKPARPVTAVLLELAYYLHATKVVARPKQNR